jgi:predicted AlkP superfamily phosphohydrolase/phosphomutase
MTLLEQFNKQEAVLAELDEQELQLQKELKDLKEQRELIMCEVITRTDVITEALAKGKKFVYKSLPVATSDWLKIYAYIEGEGFSRVSLNVKTGVLLIEPVK